VVPKGALTWLFNAIWHHPKPPRVADSPTRHRPQEGVGHPFLSCSVTGAGLTARRRTGLCFCTAFRTRRRRAAPQWISAVIHHPRSPRVLSYFDHHRGASAAPVAVYRHKQSLSARPAPETGVGESADLDRAHDYRRILLCSRGDSGWRRRSPTPSGTTFDLLRYAPNLTVMARWPSNLFSTAHPSPVCGVLRVTSIGAGAACQRVLVLVATR